MNTDLIQYYAKLAETYEQVYEKPERQRELDYLIKWLKNNFIDQRVLEIACGTGYWTQYISRAANTILAIDINESVLQIAQTKEYHCKVTFEESNMYDLKHIKQRYDACFGGFIWSHIPKQNLQLFIQTLKAKVEDTGTIIFIDNQFVKFSSTAIDSTDNFGNSYQIRHLPDGTRHKVMKNFPTDIDIEHLANKTGLKISLIRTQYYWILTLRK